MQDVPGGVPHDPPRRAPHGVRLRREPRDYQTPLPHGARLRLHRGGDGLVRVPRRGLGACTKATCALTRLTYNLHRFARLLQTWPGLSPVAETPGVGRRRAGKGETLIFSLLVTGIGIYRTCLNCHRADSIRTRIERIRLYL